MLNRNTDSIIVRSYIQLGDNALRIVRNNKYGNETSKSQKELWMNSFKIRVLLKAVEFRVRQDYKVTNKFLSCLVGLSGINDYPAAPILFNTIKRSVILPAGPAGPSGTPGANGSDANLDLVADPAYDNIAITESIVGGVKTYSIGYSPYVKPAITVSVNTGAITSPASVYREIGEVLTIPLTVTLTKFRDPVVSSTFIAPTGVDASYQTLLNIPNLNTSGTQIISISPLNIAANETFTVDIADSQNTISSSANVYFNYPILYGNSSVLGINYYSSLSKLLRSDSGVQTLGSGRAVTFNGTDQYFWFGVHNSFAPITKILDGSGFDVTGDFTVMSSQSVTSVGLTSNWTQNYTFYRTTNKTSISNKSYTFNT